jgi:hypothetical protein
MEDFGMKEIVQRHARKVRRKKRFQYASRVSGFVNDSARRLIWLSTYQSDMKLPNVNKLIVHTFFVRL